MRQRGKSRARMGKDGLRGIRARENYWKTDKWSLVKNQANIHIAQGTKDQKQKQGRTPSKTQGKGAKHRAKH